MACLPGIRISRASAMRSAFVIVCLTVQSILCGFMTFVLTFASRSCSRAFLTCGQMSAQRVSLGEAAIQAGASLHLA